MSDYKQVIVWRHDLKVRRGKQITQCAHASMMFMLDDEAATNWYAIQNKWAWLGEGMTKICVRVNSEAELDEIYAKAKEARLAVFMVTDAGHTEFHGVPTKTCLAIGPNKSKDIDKITGHLELL